MQHIDCDHVMEHVKFSVPELLKRWEGLLSIYFTDFSCNRVLGALILVYFTSTIPPWPGWQTDPGSRGD